MSHWSRIVLSAPLVCLCCLVAYIANNMDSDQTAFKGAVWSGFIVFAYMIKSSLKWTWIYAADVKSRHFQDKEILAGYELTDMRRWNFLLFPYCLKEKCWNIVFVISWYDYHLTEQTFIAQMHYNFALNVFKHVGRVNPYQGSAVGQW